MTPCLLLLSSGRRACSRLKLLVSHYASTALNWLNNESLHAAMVRLFVSCNAWLFSDSVIQCYNSKASIRTSRLSRGVLASSLLALFRMQSPAAQSRKALVSLALVKGRMERSKCKSLFVLLLMLTLPTQGCSSMEENRRDTSWHVLRRSRWPLHNLVSSCLPKKSDRQTKCDFSVLLHMPLWSYEQTYSLVNGC